MISNHNIKHPQNKRLMLRKKKSNSSTIKRLLPRIYELLEKATNSVTAGKKPTKANELFPKVKDKVQMTAPIIRILEEKGDLEQLIRLMKNDPLAESDLFANLIVSSEH